VANEDFTTYTITPDPLVYTTRTASKLDVNALPRSVTESVYKSFGANHFGDFEHKVKVNWLAASGNQAQAGYWAVADNYHTLNDISIGNNGMAASVVQTATGAKWWHVVDRTNDNTDNNAALQLDQLCVIIKRSGTTLTVKLYSDTWGGTLEDTLTITCGTTTYENISGLMSCELAGSNTVTLDIEELDLQEAAVGNPWWFYSMQRRQ